MGDRANFGSKLGVILATAGSAVGLGNVWRFPYMAGQNGGAAFILIYVGCVLLLGIPCMVSEFIIGRHAQANTARAYHKLSNGTPWALVGFLGVLTGFLITGYYAVVSGWCLQYIYASVAGQLKGSPEYITSYFQSFSQDPFKPILWTVVILLTTHFVVSHGVERGIERASKLLMPTLFILLLVIVVASCMLPGGDKGIEFLLKPDFSVVDKDVFLGTFMSSSNNELVFYAKQELQENYTWSDEQPVQGSGICRMDKGDLIVSLQIGNDMFDATYQKMF